MQTLRKLFALLTGRERIRLVALAAVAVLSGLMETAGVASILPFLQLVADPQSIETSPVLSRAAAQFGLVDRDRLLFGAGCALLAVIALSNLVSGTTVWLTNRFSWSLQHRLSTRLLGAYLRQPYRFYLGRHTSDLGKNLLVEVNNFMNMVLQPLLQVLVRLISALLILALLASVNWRLSIICLFVLGGSYALIYLALRKSQSKLGEERFELNAQMFRAAQEALSGIKTVKMLGRESEFIDRFAGPSSGLATRSAKHHTVAAVPRYALETVAFGGIVLVVLYYLQASTGLEGALPLLGLYAFAAYRLLPSMNQIFNNSVRIRFNLVSLDTLHEEFRSVDELPSASVPILIESTRSTVPAALPVGGGIRFDDVSFAYDGSHRGAIEGVNFSIEPNEVVGFAGATGAGKTTLVDLLLGLLIATGGEVGIGGVPLTAANARAWRQQCGYVPQDVFLSDQSIMANIAFGLPAPEIVYEDVVKAAQMAQLFDFIEELPDGFDTIVGERGIRLSGGQRQRIGIARALVHDPHVLVFDEATSALDGVTEAAVLETILSLARKKTLVLIAHRLTTLKRCDVIHLLADGRIEASGTYGELHESSERFRAMAAGEALPQSTPPV